MEAKIEVLTTELESQKKQNQRDNDSLKIKSKIVDDQTETIRRLKEVNTLLDVKEFNLTCIQHALSSETATACYYCILDSTGKG